MATDETLRSRQAAALLAFAFLFAVVDLAIQLLVHALLGEAGGWVYRAGALAHLLGSFLLGALVALPYARTATRGGGLVVSAALAGILLTLDAAAYQVHAAGGHLPTLAALSLAASDPVGGQALLLRSLGLGLAGLVPLVLGLERLARRLEARTATRAGRIADLITLSLFALIWAATAYGADGPLYYGATPPVLHLALGKAQEATDAPAMTLARHVHQHDHRHGHEHHHVNPADSVPPDPPPPDGIPRPPADIRLLLQQVLQSDPPRTVPDVGYPFCRGEPAPDAFAPGATPRPSVLLVDVSGLGARELAATDGSGRPLAPRLAALATEEPSFAEVHAPGTTPFPGLVAALSGLPVMVDAPSRLGEPARAPVPHLPGLAADLRRAGYATAAFSSAHLAIDDRGLLFERVGFEQVFGPSLASDAAARSGDGRADGATLDALAGWVRAHREAAPDAPYLAFATLQSARVPEGGDAAAAIAAADAAVAHLLAWYRAEEAARGTLLVLLSDHASQRPDPAIAADAPPERKARFDVPLVLVGLGDEAKARATAAKARVGGLLDVPQTVLALVGIEAPGCHQGVDLLQPDDAWPVRRVTLSFADPEQRVLVAHDGDHRWLMPLGADRASLFNVVEDPSLADDLWAESDSDWGQMKELRDAYVAMGIYLRRHDRFVPPREPEGEPLPTVETSARVASLQLGAGPEAIGVDAARLESAVRAGLSRARVPVAVTSDGVPVLAYAARTVRPVGAMTAAEIAALESPPLTLADALARFGRRIELELVVAREHADQPARILDDLRAIVAVTSARGAAAVRFSTSSPEYAYALVRGTDRPVGLELGPREHDTAWLDVAADLGCAFVTLPVGLAGAPHVQRAHNRRLALQVEGVRAAADLARYQGDMPDAIAYQELPEG